MIYIQSFLNIFTTKVCFISGFFTIITFIWIMYWQSKYNSFIKDSRYSIHYKHCICWINGKTLPLFSFEQFLKFYKLNPEVWEIIDKDGDLTIPARRVENEDLIRSGFIYCAYNYYPIYFINMFELRKYNKWGKRHIKNEKNRINQKEQNEATKKIVKFVQNDIDNIRTTYEKNLTEAEAQLQKSLINLQKEYEIKQQNSMGEIEHKIIYNGFDNNYKLIRVSLTEQEDKTWKEEII